MSRKQLAVVVGVGAMGTAVARRLSQRYRVLVADLDEDRALSVARELCGEGGDARGAGCDVTDAGSVERLARLVQDEDDLRVITHVAGLSPTMANFDTIIRVNLNGPALVADALLPLVVPQAACIMISSVAAHVAAFPENIMALLRDARSPDLPRILRRAIGEDAATSNAAYQLSKIGLLMFCRRGAAAWGARNSRILSLSPGMIATPMGALEFANNPTKRAMFEMSPMKREGTMLEIADVVEFLASDRASFISGTDILVDGGLVGALNDIPFARPAA
jgi:NAD(P)-dependent dehydrogenase (short-subunit alcohol dehydrogenase family)